jgi:hypothetical protein
MLERAPTPEEVWRARINAVVLSLGALALLVWVQWKVLRLNFYVGAGLAPLWNFGAFQLVSRLTTARTFQCRLDPRARTAAEVLDVLFTVVFLFTLTIGLAATVDSWTYVPPALPTPP